MTRAEGQSYSGPALLVKKLGENPANVAETIKNRLRRRPTLAEAVRSWRIFTNNLDALHVKEPLTGTGVGIVGLYRMVNELSTPDLWKKFIRDVDPSIQDRVVNDVGVENIDQAATHIASENQKVMIGKIAFAILAATADGEPPTEPQPSSRPQTKDDIVRNKLNMYNDMKIYYPDKPHTIDEFMAILKQLVPNPDKTSSTAEGTLFHFFTKHYLFDSEDRRCPAIQLSRLILEQWGRQLDTDAAYERRFRRTIAQKWIINDRGSRRNK